MGKEQLLNFLEQDGIWMEIKSPRSESHLILNYIERSMMKRLSALRFWRLAAGSLMVLTIMVSVAFGFHAVEPKKTLVVYPSLGKEKSVQVVAKFKGSNSKSPRVEPVAMELDEDTSLWKAIIPSKLEIEDCDFVVDNGDETPAMKEE